MMRDAMRGTNLAAYIIVRSVPAASVPISTDTRVITHLTFWLHILFYF
jgi:hypothetical protein